MYPITVTLASSDGHALAVSPLPDAPMLFTFSTVRETRAFLAEHRTGYWTTDDAVTLSAPVDAIRVTSGPYDVTADYASRVFA
jgi:hypothetical protein